MSFVAKFADSVVSVVLSTISSLKTNEDWAVHFAKYEQKHEQITKALCATIWGSKTRGEVVLWCVVLLTNRNRGTIGLSELFAMVREGETYEAALTLQIKAKKWKHEFKNPISFLSAQFRDCTDGRVKSHIPFPARQLQWTDTDLQEEYALACESIINSIYRPVERPAATKPLSKTTERPVATKPPSASLVPYARPAPCSTLVPATTLARSYAGAAAPLLPDPEPAPVSHLGDSPNEKRVTELIRRVESVGASATNLHALLDERLALRDLSALGSQFAMLEAILAVAAPEMVNVVQLAADTLANAIKQSPTHRPLSCFTVIIDGKTLNTKKALVDAGRQLRQLANEMVLLRAAVADAAKCSEALIEAVKRSGVLDEPAGFEAQALIDEVTALI